MTSITVAARELEVAPVTVRRWIAEGAPCIAPGASGRGRGALVEVEALRRWRATRSVAGQDLEELDSAIAAGLWSAYFRPAPGESDSVWKLAGVRREAAALILATAFDAIFRERFRCNPRDFPPQIAKLRAVLLISTHDKRSEDFR